MFKNSKENVHFKCHTYTHTLRFLYYEMETSFTGIKKKKKYS